MDNTKEQGDIVFALDIGTRSVVGVIGKNGSNGFEVIDYKQVHHPVNAMRDGQIEDVSLVSAVVAEVKKALEDRNSIKLSKVAVAAAGRSLKTTKAAFEYELNENEAITKAQMNSLEYSAVTNAQEAYMREHPEIASEIDFFCVGYSVVRYTLDGYDLANPEGHKGRNIKLEIIAAFLPRNVIRSVYTVTTRNDLEVDNLTLEPIAAINAIVPRELRLLNIAIVDIGAGTSDIAVSKNGSVVAYGMSTVAGDEITEAIMKEYLTDFDTAENLKINITNNEDVEFTDILGVKHNLKHEEIFGIIDGVANELCKTIAADIIRLNEVSPVAVFLVGGGSQTTGLCGKIAAELGLPPERVAVGGLQTYKNIQLFTDKLLSPEFVTPLGIGVVCSMYKGCNFFATIVNGKRVMLLNQNECKVMDALLTAGIKPTRLIGLTSRSLAFTLNGKRVIKSGNPPVPGKLTVNGAEASIDTPIKQGDEIVAVDAVNGEPFILRIRDVIGEFTPLRVMFDNGEVCVWDTIYVNSEVSDIDYVIRDGDVIDIVKTNTLEGVLTYLNKDKSLTYEVNRNAADLNCHIETGDIIKTRKPDTVQSSVESNPIGDLINAVQSINICVNGVWRKVIPHENRPLIFADMLNYVDINTDRQDGTLVLRLNGSSTSYTQPVREGDVVEITWED